MPTFVTDSHARYDTVISGDPVPEKQPKRVLDRLDESIPKEGDPCVWNGHPCILFGMLDLAEDWSGEYVNPDIHPFALLNLPKLSTQDFWALVRKVHALAEPTT
jgi:hypothetical protein